MTEIHDRHAAVPEHLRRRTIETMPLDTPYYVSLARDMSDHEAAMSDRDDAVWVDETTGCLQTYTDVELDEEDRESARSALAEAVPMMKVELFDERYQVHQGLVADLRYIDEGVLGTFNDDEPPEDPELFQSWADARENTTSFIAIATLDSSDDAKPQLVLSGDPLFYDALRYLMTQVDNLPNDVAPDNNKKSEAAGRKSINIKKLLGKFARRNG